GSSRRGMGVAPRRLRAGASASRRGRSPICASGGGAGGGGPAGRAGGGGGRALRGGAARRSARVAGPRDGRADRAVGTMARRARTASLEHREIPRTRYSRRDQEVGAMTQKEVLDELKGLVVERLKFDPRRAAEMTL